MLEEQLVSIIVPVYNVEHYLKRCVDSILQQTYTNIELILVDDGSTDKSGKICDTYCAADDRITVIHQKNKGNSSARNNGYQQSTGEYFMFVDSDDSLSKQAITELVEAAETNNADIVIGTMNRPGKATLDFVNITKDSAVKMCINQCRYRVESDMPSYEKYINPGSPCMKLIRKAICGGIVKLFEEDIKTHHEDTLFSICMYLKTNKIVLLDSHPYLYDTSIPNSLTKCFYPHKIEEIRKLLYCMDRILNLGSASEEICETLKCDFVTNMVYECWSDYFTSTQNKALIADRVKELKILLQDVNVKGRLGRKGCMSSYKVHQKMVLKCMEQNMFLFLSILSKVWAKLKGK